MFALNQSKVKLKTLRLTQNVKLIIEIEQNPKCKKIDVSLKYEISLYFLSIIFKNQTVLKRYESKLPSLCKRVKICAYPDIEAGLLKLFGVHKTQKSKISFNKILFYIKKAVDFTCLLNAEVFNASVRS